MEMFKNAAGYAPMLVNLEGYWDKPLAELPSDELKAMVKLLEEEVAHSPWDSLDIANRKNFAAQYDYQHDPKYEPATCWELSRFAFDLDKWIEQANEASKDQAIVAYRKVADRIRQILEVDRERVGCAIQKLREQIAAAEGVAAENEKLRAESAEEKKLTTTDRAHFSAKLTKMNQAAAKFWANTDRDDRNTHPSNAIVVEWFAAQPGFSATLADKAATIIRPEWARTGRKPEK